MATETETPHGSEHGNHPGVGQYVEIGIILAVLTAIEIALYYAGQAGVSSRVTIPSILFLTVLKFVLVVMWFMHLRFDHRVLRRLFVAGMVLAGVVYGIVLLISFTSPIVTQV
jgi:cytochrome c oxidase subunit IV